MYLVIAGILLTGLVAIVLFTSYELRRHQRAARNARSEIDDEAETIRAKSARLLDELSQAVCRGEPLASSLQAYRGGREKLLSTSGWSWTEEDLRGHHATLLANEGRDLANKLVFRLVVALSIIGFLVGGSCLTVYGFGARQGQTIQSQHP